MKLSELIKEGQDLLFKHGDLRVNIFMKCLDGIHDGFYPLELKYRKATYFLSKVEQTSLS